ncbi:MAG: RNase P subunit p30 family protein [Nanoarchaeota archaeon]
MIDIVQFSGDQFNLGFRKIFPFKQFNIIEGGTDEKNSAAVERKSTDILLTPEKDRNKRYFTQQDSGLNHILCRSAAKNRVAIGFSFAAFLNAKERSKVLAQMMQNVRLCQKYKIRMVVGSFAKNKWEMRMPLDLCAFAQILGMTPKEAKAALNFQRKQKDIKIYKNEDI